MTDDRREGDTRPLDRPPQVSLTLFPASHQPFRWLPRHGEPLCIGEWLSHKIIRAVAFLPVYIAIVTTLTLLVVVFGVPFVEGD